MTKKTENEKELKMVKKSTAKKPTVKKVATKTVATKKAVNKTVATYCDNDVLATEAVWNATKKESVKKQTITKKKNVVPKDFMNKPTKTSQNASKTSQKASESIKKVKKVPAKIVKVNASKKPSIKKIVAKKVNANDPVKRETVSVILYKTDLASSLFLSKTDITKFYKIVDTILDMLGYDHDKSKLWHVYVESKVDNGIFKLHVRSVCSKSFNNVEGRAIIIDKKAKIKHPNKYYKVVYVAYNTNNEISFADKIAITEITKNDF